jgi:hypothetical protein
MSEAVILTIINVGIGTVAMKLLEFFSNKRVAEKDEIAKYHATLLEENKRLREELRQCNKEVDEWQSRYYTGRVENNDQT